MKMAAGLKFSYAVGFCNRSIFFVSIFYIAMASIGVNVSQAYKHKRVRRTYIDAELLEELHNQHVGGGASVISHNLKH